MGLEMSALILQPFHFEHLKSEDLLGDTLPFTNKMIGTFKSSLFDYSSLTIMKDSCTSSGARSKKSHV